MERFFVNGGKDPWFFYKRIMETVYPPHTKKSSNLLEELSLEVETRKLNNEWQEESKGLFGLKKESMPLEEDNILSWFDRNEFNCGALRLPLSTEDLFIFLEDRHLNFFESMIQANIRKEPGNYSFDVSHHSSQKSNRSVPQICEKRRFRRQKTTELFRSTN